MASETNTDSSNDSSTLAERQLCRAVRDVVPTPVPPDGITGTSSLEGVSLSWILVAEKYQISSYKVYRASIEGGPYGLLGTVTSGNPAVYLDTTGTPSVQYWYRVTSFNVSGKESTYAAVQAMRWSSDTIAPDTPVFSSVGQTGATAVTLTWLANNEADVAGYQLFSGPSSMGGWTPLSVSLITLRTFTDTTVAAGDTVYYQLKAVDTSGNVSDPAGTSITVSLADTFAPQTPVGLFAQPYSDRIKLSWTANTEPDFLKYQVYRASGKSRLGINIEGPYDYSQGRFFIDLVRTARHPFGPPLLPYQTTGGPSLDSNGWPTGDVGITLFTEQTHVGGDYKFSFTGVGTIATSGSSFSVVSQAYDSGTNTTSGILRFPDSESPLAGYVKITGTTGGVTNIKVLRPGYTSDANIFTNEFLAAISPFGGLRFMDACRVNNNTITDWANRSLLTDATWSTKTGWPYEVIISLAQATGKDVWVCIPAQANDDFTTQMAVLFVAGIPVGQKMDFEYSNEVWNGIFSQFTYNNTAAGTEATTDAIYAASAEVQNNFYYGWMRTAKQAYLFKQKLGPADTRFRTIYATQLGYNPAGVQAKNAFTYIRNKYGSTAVRDTFDAVAIAPYYGVAGMDADGLLAEDIAAATLLAAQGNTATKPQISGFKAFADSWSVKLVCYEGGADLFQYNRSVSEKILAQFQDDSGKAITASIGSILSTFTDSRYMYYNFSNLFNSNGYWGLVDNLTNLVVPKYVAAVEVAGASSTTGGTTPFVLIAEPTTSIYEDKLAPQGLQSTYKVLAVDTSLNVSGESTVTATRPITLVPVDPNDPGGGGGNPIPPITGPLTDFVFVAGGMAPCGVWVRGIKREFETWAVQSNKTAKETLVSDDEFPALSSGTELTARYQWNMAAGIGNTQDRYPTCESWNYAHLYESPGTYTATLTRTQDNGQVGVYTASIVVAADTRRTIYVSATGTASADGSKKTSPTTIATAQSALAGNDAIKVLLKEGDVWATAGTLLTITKKNCYIGSWRPDGAVVGNKPKIRNSGVTGTIGYAISVRGSSEGTVISGLAFDTTGNDNKSFTAIKDDSGHGCVVKDCDFIRVGRAVGFEETNLTSRYFLMLNGRAPTYAGVTNNYAYLTGQDLVFLGDAVVDATLEHVLRGNNMSRVCIAYGSYKNDYTASDDLLGKFNVSALKTVLNLQSGRWYSIFSNKFEAGRGGQAGLNPGAGETRFGPLAGVDGHVEHTTKYVRFEANTLTNTWLSVSHGVQYAMICNNIVKHKDWWLVNIEGKGSGLDAAGQSYANHVTSDVFLYDNTLINIGTTTGILDISFGVQNLFVKNNLGVGATLLSNQLCIRLNYESPNTSTFFDRNVWPVLGRFYFNEATTNIATWNSQIIVGGDILEAQTLSAIYEPSASSQTAIFGRPVAGVYRDFSGGTRSRSDTDWAVGAVETTVGGNNPDGVDSWTHGVGGCFSLLSDAGNDVDAAATVKLAKSLGLTYLRSFYYSCQIGGTVTAAKALQYKQAVERVTKLGLKVITMLGGPEKKTDETAEAWKARWPFDLDDWTRYFDQITASRASNTLWLLEGQNEMNLDTQYFPYTGTVAARVTSYKAILQRMRTSFGGGAYIIGTCVGWNSSTTPHTDYAAEFISQGFKTIVSAWNIHSYFASGADILTCVGAYFDDDATKPIFMTEINVDIPIATYAATVPGIINNPLKVKGVRPCVYRFHPQTTGNSSRWNDRCLADVNLKINQPVAQAWSLIL